MALEGARESMVLLKNDRNTLPLNKNRMRTVAIIGPNAFPAVPLGGGSATIPTFHAVSFVEGLGDNRERRVRSRSSDVELGRGRNEFHN